MSWDHQQYVDFIKKHAPAAVRSSLLQANSKPYVPKDIPTRGKPPKIFATYYSMPDWLDIFSSPTKSLASPKVRLDSRLGNTPFDRVIAEYNDAVKNHQDKVAGCLDLIDPLPCGKALLAELGATEHSVRIMPYWHFFRQGAEYFNSWSIPVGPRESLSYIADGTVRDYEDAYEKNAPVRNDDNTPFGSEKGTGKGANVVLFFSAEIWESKGAPKGPGFKPDEVLFHELVHVTRLIRGRFTHVKVEGKGGYGNIEEYFATVISNVYLSDKGQTALRGFYSDDLIQENRRRVNIGKDEIMVITDLLPKDWSVMEDPDNFYNNPDKLNIPPRQLMQIFKDKQPDFYFALAHLPEIKPKFNPVGQHFRENFHHTQVSRSKRP
jgi:Effector protein